MTNKTLFSLLLLFSIGIAHSCKNKNDDKPWVSASILPQQYLIERIADGYVKVNVMVPPGMNPATCDLNPTELQKFYDSDIYFMAGHLPFELTHLQPILKKQNGLRVINHSEGLALAEGSCNHDYGHEGHHHHSVDPHIWLSPKYAKLMAEDIFNALAAQYPEKRQDFKTNYDALLHDIDQIATKADSVLATKQHKIFLIYHPALTYFAKDYGMEQISIEHEGKEPGPAHLKEVIDLIKEKDIRMILIQNQFDVNNAQSVAKQTGIEIIPIDPLSPDWLAEMNTLIGIFDTKLN